jgi:hypothetical protein
MKMHAVMIAKMISIQQYWALQGFLMPIFAF